MVGLMVKYRFRNKKVLFAVGVVSKRVKSITGRFAPLVCRGYAGINRDMQPHRQAPLLGLWPFRRKPCGEPWQGCMARPSSNIRGSIMAILERMAVPAGRVVGQLWGGEGIVGSWDRAQRVGMLNAGNA